MEIDDGEQDTAEDNTPIIQKRKNNFVDESDVEDFDHTNRVKKYKADLDELFKNWSLTDQQQVQSDGSSVEGPVRYVDSKLPQRI
jgi:hypothetical protein